MIKGRNYEILVVGVSAGGYKALNQLLPGLAEDLGMTVVIVQHCTDDSELYFVEHFDKVLSMKVSLAESFLTLEKNQIYFAPGGYHLLIEMNHTFSLSRDPPVQYSRPSIDVLFESASDVYDDMVIGVLLTGANSDGACGLHKIYLRGGYTIVQNPETAYSKIMPDSAIKLFKPNNILDLQDIASNVNSLVTKGA